MQQHYERYTGSRVLMPCNPDPKTNELIAVKHAAQGMLGLDWRNRHRVGMVRRVMHPILGGRYIFLVEYGVGHYRNFDERDDAQLDVVYLYLDYSEDFSIPYGLQDLLVDMAGKCKHIGKSGEFSGIMMNGVDTGIPANKTIKWEDLPFTEEWANV